MFIDLGIMRCEQVLGVAAKIQGKCPQRLLFFVLDCNVGCVSGFGQVQPIFVVLLPGPCIDAEPAH